MQIHEGWADTHEHVLAFCERLPFQKRRRRSAGGISLCSCRSSRGEERRTGESGREAGRTWRREKKTPEKNENERYHPLLRSAPASCGSFRLETVVVGFHSKARVTGAHLRISRGNSTLRQKRGNVRSKTGGRWIDRGRINE